MNRCYAGTNLLVALLMSLAVITSAAAEKIRLAVTTSFHNSGLADHILPVIEKDLGVKVHLLVVGTGQALKLARAGDVDAILVHFKAAEEQFVSDGHATHRRQIMYNDFVIIGPSTDPANIADKTTASTAFAAIARSAVPFVSRGDESGTHRAELTIWEAAGLKPGTFDPSWYREIGAGMGAALNAASAMGAYTLSDRASWLNFANKGGLKLLFSGDPALFNQYSFLPVNPHNHPHVAGDLARKLEAWLTSAKGQRLIGAYAIGTDSVFVPNAQ